MPRNCLCLLLVLAGCCFVGCGTKANAAKKSTKKTASRPSVTRNSRVRSGKAAKLADDGQTAKATPDADRLHPVVVLNTTEGKITIRLDREHAPRTVDSFLKYVEAGHYNGTI